MMNEKIEQFLRKKVLNIGDDDYIKIEEQKGGLFNKVLKVTHEDEIWFIKEYLDKNVSSVFSPPKISAQIRSELAYIVQNQSFLLCSVEKTVPKVHYYSERNTLFVEGVENPVDMINVISSGNIKLKHSEIIAKSISKLHNYYLNSKECTNSLFLNSKFRDFKLELQYTQIASQLGGEYENIINKLSYRYKNQLNTVLHGDLNSRNIVINNNDDNIGIIDFEQSHIGNPIYDISYFLCEIYISCLFFKKIDFLKKYVFTFLNSYTKHCEFELKEYSSDFKLHLAVQIIYRFIGPSKNSWTFYINNGSEILEFAKNILITNNEAIIDEYLGLIE